MTTSVPIGEFAKMTYLSQKALRLYHQQGILEPLEVDPVTGYRRYSLEQVTTGQIIRRLRELEMPLEDIKTFVNADGELSRNTALLLHLRRLTRQLTQTQSAVESLQQLLLGGISQLPVEIRRLAPLRVLAITEEIDAGDLDTWWGDTFAVLDSTVEEQHGASGVAGALYSNEFFSDERGQVTAFLEWRTDGPPVDVEISEMPAATVAVATHVGPFADLDQTYGALGTWVTERTLGAPGPVREHYLTSSRDTSDATRHRTEVCWPLSAVPAVPT